MTKKTILNLSAVTTGGAGNYARQNHSLLLKSGYDSYLVVKAALDTPEERVIQYPDSKWLKIIPKIKRNIWRSKLNRIGFDEKYLFYNKYERFNCYSAYRILKLLPRLPDAIFVYWVSGFINAKILQDLSKLSKAQIVIFMIDNAPMTGGCHYPWDCKEFEKRCGTCPAILNNQYKDLAQKNLNFKLQHNLDNVTLITATQTDYIRTKESTLYKNQLIIKQLEIVDDELFKPPVSKPDMKKYFNININEKVIFIGASFLNERRKGMKELWEAIDLLKNDNCILLIAGSDDNRDIKKKHIRTGLLSNDDLIKAYQAADVFVCPSLEDSGPLMINQALMCGTPVVAFNMGSATDLVITQKTGYLAKHLDISDLAYGIDHILSLSENEWINMSHECRALALNYISINTFRKFIDGIFG